MIYTITLLMAYMASHGQPPLTVDAMAPACAKGLPTGQVMHIVESPGVSVTEAYYYDVMGRLIQSHSTNHLNGSDHTYLTYSFTDKETERLHRQLVPGNTELTERTVTTYDSYDRPSVVTLSVNGGAARTIAHYTYDAIGRPSTRSFGGIQTVTKNYNIRNQTTKIQSPKFTETIHYAESISGLTPQYGGNISGISWTAPDSEALRGYRFSYDGMSRLTSALSTDDNVSNGHHSAWYEYDVMGNITSLRRNGLLDNGTYGTVDSLSYSYDGNRVTHIEDLGDSPTYAGATDYPEASYYYGNCYSYDACGNVTKDMNRSAISITYNLLNQPMTVRYFNGATATYRHDADGTKVTAIYRMPLSVGTTSVYYCGNVVYRNEEPVYLLFDGGYVSFSSGSPQFHFYLSDHLGSNRVVLAEDGTVEQVTHYYPYGVPFPESTGQSVQPYKYTGKELETMHGLRMSDFEARWYGMADPRFYQPDPLMEKYYSWSPYTYCLDNPVNLFDPSGKEPVYNLNGNYLGMTSEGFTGEVMIYSGDEIVDFNLFSRKDLERRYGSHFRTFDQVKQGGTGGFTNDAKSKIWTNVVSHFENTVVYDERFSMSSVMGGKIEYQENEGSWESVFDTPHDYGRISGNDQYSYETTVENLASSIIVHEWYSHIRKKAGSYVKTHRLAYKNVINYKRFWNKTTDSYKYFYLKGLLDYTKEETGRKRVDPPYRNLYKKYVIDK